MKSLIERISWFVVAVAALTVMAILLPAKAAAADRQDNAEIAYKWLQAFKTYGITRAQIEEFLAHPLEELNRDDSLRLQGLLNAVRRGENVAISNKAAENHRTEPQAALSPVTAAKLSEQVDQSYEALKSELKKVGELLAKMPASFPPDLKAESITIDKFLDVVRAAKLWAAQLEKEGPEMLQAATMYRLKLKEAISALAKSAEDNRADNDALFAKLASTQDMVVQVYTKRLEWAEGVYHDLHVQLTTAKRSQKLLSRWEATLLLMGSATKEGCITEDNLRRLLQYQETLEKAMNQFRKFGELMRASSEAGSTAPSKANGATPSPTPAKPADKP